MRNYGIGAKGYEDEFKAILSMPDDFIRNRLVSNWKDIDTIEGRWMPYVRDWMSEFYQLSSVDRELLISTIASGDIRSIKNQFAKAQNSCKKLLEYHLEADKIVATAQIQSNE